MFEGEREVEIPVHKEREKYLLLHYSFIRLFLCYRIQMFTYTSPLNTCHVLSPLWRLPMDVAIKIAVTKKLLPVVNDGCTLHAFI